MTGAQGASYRNLSQVVAWGMRRIATVAESSINLNSVLGRTVSDPQLLSLVDDAGMISSDRAQDSILDYWQSSPYRCYTTASGPAEHVVLGYAYTHNNRRELTFLSRLLEKSGLSAEVLNICDASYKKRAGVSGSVKDALGESLRAFMRPRSRVSLGLVHHLRKFGPSVQAAYDSLAEVPYKVLAVANDHSPAPVAYAAVARHLGLRVLYVQHAEVSDIFPALDFDLSILRNRRSMQVYERVGDVGGRAVVAARAIGDWIRPKAVRNSQKRLAAGSCVSVVVYPSSVVDLRSLQAIVRDLSVNPYVSNVAVKAHPNSRVDLSAELNSAVPVIETLPGEPHVAICGNSSVAVELMAAGNLVYQDFSLDPIVPDYYGLVALGLTRRGDRSFYQSRFWRDYRVFGRESFARLSDLVPNLDTLRNRLEARGVSSALRAVMMN